MKKIVKKFGDQLIKNAEQYVCAASWVFSMHEIEKPECLKRLDRERMQEGNKEVK